MSRYTQTMTSEALSKLRELLKAGDTIYVIQRHKAPSGVSRVLSLVLARGNRVLDLTLRAAIVLSKGTLEKMGKPGIRVVAEGLDKRGANIGAEADFAQALVAALSREVFSDRAPKAGKADPDSPDLTHRPASQWLLAEWL